MAMTSGKPWAFLLGPEVRCRTVNMDGTEVVDYLLCIPGWCAGAAGAAAAAAAAGESSGKRCARTPLVVTLWLLPK